MKYYYLPHEVMDGCVRALDGLTADDPARPEAVAFYVAAASTSTAIGCKMPVPAWLENWIEDKGD